MTCKRPMLLVTRTLLVVGCRNSAKDGPATADPASFDPNWDQLDAVIRSLKLPH